MDLEQIVRHVERKLKADQVENDGQFSTGDYWAIGLMLFCLVVVVLALIAICIMTIMDETSSFNLDRIINRNRTSEFEQTEDFQDIEEPSTPTFSRDENGHPPAYNTLFVNVINVPPPTYQEAIQKIA